MTPTLRAGHGAASSHRALGARCVYSCGRWPFGGGRLTSALPVCVPDPSEPWGRWLLLVLSGLLIMQIMSHPVRPL